jgi:hypothetical protein
MRRATPRCARRSAPQRGCEQLGVRAPRAARAGLRVRQARSLAGRLPARPRLRCLQSEQHKAHGKPALTVEQVVRPVLRVDVATCGAVPAKRSAVSQDAVARRRLHCHTKPLARRCRAGSAGERKAHLCALSCLLTPPERTPKLRRGAQSVNNHASQADGCARARSSTHRGGAAPPLRSRRASRPADSLRMRTPAGSCCANATRDAIYRAERKRSGRNGTSAQLPASYE